MLPFKLGYTDDGNKGIITWGFKTGETKMRKGPPSFIIVGDGKCEITLIAIREGDASFDNIGNRSPLRLECEGFNEPFPLECLHWITY